MSDTQKRKKAADDFKTIDAYQTPEAKKAHDAQEEQKAQRIIDKIKLIAFTIDFLKDPEAAILSRKLISRGGERDGQDITQDVYKQTMHISFDSLVKTLVASTGEAPEKIWEQIFEPEKQDPELTFQILQVKAIEQHGRFETLTKSRYFQAIDTLEALEAKAPNKESTDDIVGTQEQAVLYFFALHEDLKPTAAEQLTEEQKEELKAIFYRLDKYYAEIGQDTDGFEAFYNFIEKDIQPKINKKAAAEAGGVITTIAERLFVPSDKEYQDAFITKVGNSNIGLFKRDTEKGKKQLALDINITFLQALAKVVFIAYMNEKRETNIYFPALARELGYDLNEKKKDGENSPTRAESREAFINSLIIELDNIWGKLPKDPTEYKLISIHAYNPETEVLYFVSPYLQQLIAAQIGKEAAQLESGKPYYSWSCDLLHSTAANERNPAAVEMATRLLVGLQQRGLKPDAKLKQNKDIKYKDTEAITYSITCKGLIEECPKIRERLKGQPTATQRTKTLNRTFTAMYKILKKKTDLFTYYSDVKINEVIPTTKSIDTEIIITHHGRNPKYNRPLLPIIEEPQQAQTE